MAEREHSSGSPTTLESPAMRRLMEKPPMLWNRQLLDKAFEDWAYSGYQVEIVS